MDQLRVCRSCLATDAKLYSVLNHPSLKDAYKIIRGSMDIKWDDMPHYICNFCAIVLLKFLAFKNKCDTAQILLDEALTKNGMVTNDYVRGINRMSYNLTIHFTVEEEDMCVVPLNQNEYITYSGSKTNKPDLHINYENKTVGNVIKSESNFEHFIKLEPEQLGINILYKTDSQTRGFSDSIFADRIKKESYRTLTIENEETAYGTESLPQTDIDLDLLSDTDLNIIDVSEEDNTLEVSQIENETVTENKSDVTTVITIDPARESKINNTNDFKVQNPKKRSSVSKLRNVCKKINKSCNKGKRKGQKNMPKDIKDDVEANKANEVKYNYKRVSLTKEQQLERMEARRNSKPYQQACFKCEKCYRGYYTEQRLKCHMVIHDVNRGPHVCELCGFRFKFPVLLKNHMNAVHRYNYICNLCSFRAWSSDHAKLHHQWHQGVRYTCRYCGAVFEKSSTCFTHMRVVHPGENISCELCGETFLGARGLRIHKLRAHREQCEVLPKPYCNSCGRQYSSYAALERHAELMPNGACRHTELRPCFECGEYLESKVSLALHVSQQHEVVEGDTPSYQCKQCTMTFTSENSRDVHYARVHLQITWKKPMQGKVSQTRGYCKQAGIQRKHPSGTNAFFFCEVCGKTVRAPAWPVHQRVHTGERPYKCAHCPKAYGSKVSLQFHLRAHTGERPYKCESCNMTFSQPSSLKRHEVVHTGEKRYKCHLCGNSFTQAGSLQTHIKSVHMKLPMPPRIRRKKPASAVTIKTE